MLPRDSAGLYLLQRIRDEAHRFAQGYYHKVRHREVFRSALDGIPGIGAKRKRALLKKFRSAADIRAASVEELRSVPGMTGDAARRLKEYL